MATARELSTKPEDTIRHRGLNSNTTTTNDKEAHNEVATLSPPVGQFIIGTIINIAGIAAAIAFGIFAVRSVALAATANNQAEINNQIALINYCAPNVDVST